MARARRFVGQGRTPRRRVSWSPGPNGILSPASTAVSLFPTGSQAVVDDLTLVRTRGELLLVLLTSSIAQGGFQWAFGMCVVTDNAFTVGGVGAVPAPLLDIAWDGWFFHSQGALKSPSGTIADMSSARVLRVPIDSKAMRKLHNTDVVIGVLETVEVGTATMHAELRSRLLDKLP